VKHLPLRKSALCSRPA